MAEPSILGNLKLNTAHKFVLYVSTIIFIGTLFISTHGYDLTKIQHISFVVMICGAIIWFAKELMETFYGMCHKESSWAVFWGIAYIAVDILYAIILISQFVA